MPEAKRYKGAAGKFSMAYSGFAFNHISISSFFPRSALGVVNSTKTKDTALLVDYSKHKQAKGTVRIVRIER